MHEFDVTKELIRQIKEIVINNKINKKFIVELELGKLSTYSSEPIEFYFEQLCKSDDLLKKKGVNLKINIVSGKVKCKDCNNVFETEDYYSNICDKCDSTNTEIISGKDLMIKKIEY